MEDKGFTVKDRRKIFNESPREETASSTREESKSEEGQHSQSTQQSPRNSTTILPEINFSTFILSLSTSTLMHLGELPNPDTNKTEKNLPLAKQTIDLIDMLKKKTEGNLDQEEENLITNLLSDLKLKYVAALKKG